MTELLDALYRGQQDRVDELLADEPQLTVHEAAAFGKTERLHELLDEDPSRANEFGDDGFQPLGLACFFGHVDAARFLLDRGADPNTLARNEHIQTSALHAAAASENKDPETRYDLCRMLLERGADPNLRQGGRDDGARAIDSARMTGHDRLEQLLLEHGGSG
jgi:ankyrin repeat protein